MTIPNYEFGKGQYTFYPIELSRFGEEMPKFQKAGPLQTGSNSYKRTKNFKNIILEGSRHPNLMNHFEYGKSFHKKPFSRSLDMLK